LGWRFATITASTGTVTNQIATNALILMLGAGEAFIDDVSLVPLSGPYAGINIVTNGDFEAPLTGTWSVPASMANSDRTNLYAHSGNYCLHVVATNTGSIVNSIRRQ